VLLTLIILFSHTCEGVRKAVAVTATNCVAQDECCMGGEKNCGCVAAGAEYNKVIDFKSQIEKQSLRRKFQNGT
jgi:hypothetical protein